VAYSITTQNKRRSLLDRSQPRSSPSSVFQERNQCFTASFALAAGVSAAGFWVHSGGVCPASANDGNINLTQCALDSVFGAILSLLTAFSIRGIIVHGASSKRDDTARLPFNDTTIIEGYAITIRHVENDVIDLIPTGLGWTDYHLEATDLDTLDNYTSVYSVHDCGRKRITTDVAGGSVGLEKRASSYKAYYGWTDGDTSAFKSQAICKTKAAAKSGAEAIWNVSIPWRIR
jgi:hypothetical protein